MVVGRLDIGCWTLGPGVSLLAVAAPPELIENENGPGKRPRYGFQQPGHESEYFPLIGPVMGPIKRKYP